MTQDEALKALQAANAFITLVNPLLGGAIQLGSMLVREIRSQGADIGPFADEIAKFDAAISTGLAADAAWRERHGLAPTAGTQQGPPPSSTTGTTPKSSFD